VRASPCPAWIGGPGGIDAQQCVPVNEWMKENGSSAVGDKFVGHVRREREEIVAGLRLTRVQIRTARKALG
jgi:hypothetical protein